MRTCPPLAEHWQTWASGSDETNPEQNRTGLIRHSMNRMLFMSDHPVDLVNPVSFFSVVSVVRVSFGEPRDRLGTGGREKNVPPFLNLCLRSGFELHYMV